MHAGNSDTSLQRKRRTALRLRCRLVSIRAASNLVSHRLRYNAIMDLDAALQRLSRQPDAPLDVAELSLHLARDEFPQVDVDAYLAELDAMAVEAKRYIRGDLK